MRGSAVIIGSGPNGLAAAIQLARNGLTVEVHEAAAVFGGATRSAEVTLPGFVHDLGSAVHPMAASSPFFRSLELEKHGLEWVFPPAALAHPLDDGSAVMLTRDIGETAHGLGIDERAYVRLFEPLARHWVRVMADVLKPMPCIPHSPFLMASFGIRAIQPASFLSRTLFRTERARALFAGLAAHSFLKLESPLSAAFGIILGASGHAVGWPVAKGGSQSIANTLAKILESLGGRIITNSPVTSLAQLGNPDLVLCDVSPKQFLTLADDRLPSRFGRSLRRYRFGPGAFKVDWALREPIPWTATESRKAGTVHIGGTLKEIADSERLNWQGKASPKPFVLLSQPSLFDPTRCPPGRHTAWAYCHVPNAWPGSQLEAMEDQIERFAPGFRDCILARTVHNPAAMERFDQNLIGGDINGGAADLEQFIFRPTWRQYATPLKGVYLCSASTPPGGGVHGMCGYNAANAALNWMRGRVRVR